MNLKKVRMSSIKFSDNARIPKNIEYYTHKAFNVAVAGSRTSTTGENITTIGFDNRIEEFTGATNTISAVLERLIRIIPFSVKYLFKSHESQPRTDHYTSLTNDIQETLSAVEDKKCCSVFIHEDFFKIMKELNVKEVTSLLNEYLPKFIEQSYEINWTHAEIAAKLEDLFLEVSTLTDDRCLGFLSHPLTGDLVYLIMLDYLTSNKIPMGSNINFKFYRELLLALSRDMFYETKIENVLGILDMGKDKMGPLVWMVIDVIERDKNRAKGGQFLRRVENLACGFGDRTPINVINGIRQILFSNYKSYDMFTEKTYGENFDMALPAGIGNAQASQLAGVYLSGQPIQTIANCTVSDLSENPISGMTVEYAKDSLRTMNYKKISNKLDKLEEDLLDMKTQEDRESLLATAKFIVTDIFDIQNRDENHYPEMTVLLDKTQALVEKIQTTPLGEEFNPYGENIRNTVKKAVIKVGSIPYKIRNQFKALPDIIDPDLDKDGDGVPDEPMKPDLAHKYLMGVEKIMMGIGFSGKSARVAQQRHRVAKAARDKANQDAEREFEEKLQQRGTAIADKMRAKYEEQKQKALDKHQEKKAAKLAKKQAKLDGIIGNFQRSEAESAMYAAGAEAYIDTFFEFVPAWEDSDPYDFNVTDDKGSALKGFAGKVKNAAVAGSKGVVKGAKGLKGGLQNQWKILVIKKAFKDALICIDYLTRNADDGEYDIRRIALDHLQYWEGVAYQLEDDPNVSEKIPKAIRKQIKKFKLKLTKKGIKVAGDATRIAENYIPRNLKGFGEFSFASSKDEEDSDEDDYLNEAGEDPRDTVENLIDEDGEEKEEAMEDLEDKVLDRLKKRGALEDEDEEDDPFGESHTSRGEGALSLIKTNKIKPNKVTPKDKNLLKAIIGDLEDEIAEAKISRDDSKLNKLIDKYGDIYGAYEGLFHCKFGDLKKIGKRNTWYIAFHYGDTVYGKLIKGYTKGAFSHVDLVYNNTVYTALADKGVGSVDINEDANVVIYELNNKYLSNKRMFEFINGESGKAYGWWEVAKSQLFKLSGKDKAEFAAYFCSQFISAALDYSSNYYYRYKGKTLKSIGYAFFTPIMLFKMLILGDGYLVNKHTLGTPVNNQMGRGENFIDDWYDGKVDKDYETKIQALENKINQSKSKGDMKTAYKLSSKQALLKVREESKYYTSANKMNQGNKWKKDTFYVAFFSPHENISRVIKAYENSPLSHVDVITNGATLHAMGQDGHGLEELKLRGDHHLLLYELNNKVDKKKIIEFCEKTAGTEFSMKPFYKGLVGINDKSDRYFCSKWVICLLDYATNYTLTFRGKKLKDFGYNHFTPQDVFELVINSDLIVNKSNKKFSDN